MKQGTLESIKLLRLKHKLGLPTWQAVGLLECLWNITYRTAPAGDIGKLSNQELAAMLDYHGDADALVRALVDTKWIDEDGEFRLVIHDWSHHAANWLKASFKARGVKFADEIANARKRFSERGSETPPETPSERGSEDAPYHAIPKPSQAMPCHAAPAMAQASPGGMVGVDGAGVRAALAACGVNGTYLDDLAAAPGITTDAIKAEWATVRGDSRIRNRTAVLVTRLAARYGVEKPVASGINRELRNAQERIQRLRDARRTGT